MTQSKRTAHKDESRKVRDSRVFDTDSSSVTKKRPNEGDSTSALPSSTTTKKARTDKELKNVKVKVEQEPQDTQYDKIDEIRACLCQILAEENLPGRLIKRLEERFGSLAHTRAEVKQLIADAILQAPEASDGMTAAPDNDTETECKVAKEEEVGEVDQYKLRPVDGRIYAWVEGGFDEYRFYDAKDLDNVLPLIKALGQRYGIPNQSPLHIYRKLEGVVIDDEEMDKIEQRISNERAGDGVLYPTFYGAKSPDSTQRATWDDFNAQAANMAGGCSFVEIIVSKEKPEEEKDPFVEI
ncbi:hypothetical protein HDV00_004027 [Rhizophlyctis rosea]|nr:hypothetical protein HDV00_004027 [Rhizophlyctis rosea]